MVCINLDEKYVKGLRGLDGYSHVQVLWWADACDNEYNRNILVEEKPYKNGPDKIGVFALHSPERPNPIAVSNVNIAYVDIEPSLMFQVLIELKIQVFLIGANIGLSHMKKVADLIGNRNLISRR